MNDSVAQQSPTELWVHQLHDYRTRRQARQSLIRAGATDALIECLSSGNDSVVWAAVQSLPDVPDSQRAIAPLIEMIEASHLAMDAADALRKITGKDCGLNAKAWREELSLAAPTRQAIAGPADPRQCIQEAAQLLSIEAKPEGPGFYFDLDLPEDRRQRVFIVLGRRDSEGDEMTMVYSPCGPADTKFFEEALRMNSRIPAGAMAIHDVDGAPYFVMVDVLLTETLHARQLAKSIREIAQRADRVEESLGMDKH